MPVNKEHCHVELVIEREMPGLGEMSSDDLARASAKSNGVLAEMSPHVRWIEKQETADKLYCVYVADDADLVREHARRAAASGPTPSRSRW